MMAFAFERNNSQTIKRFFGVCLVSIVGEYQKYQRELRVRARRFVNLGRIIDSADLIGGE